MAGSKMAKIIRKIAKNWLVYLLLFAIILLGNKLRTFSYAAVPHAGEVADEYAWGWLGLSLIINKYPESWSLNSYQDMVYKKINVDFIYDKNPETKSFAIIKPSFDNPPLFGLITGGYAYLKGIRDFEQASVAILRRPMLKIALISTVLIFILASRFYGYGVGLLSAALYSVIPTMVISSRLALIENGYTPLFLAGLILADIYFKKRKKLIWILAVFLASLAILFKLSAISICLTLFILALFYGSKDKKFLTYSVVAGITFALVTFIIYGALIDWPVFVSTFLQNSQRFYGAGSEILLQIITQSRITTNRFFTDGWIAFGWISLMLVTFTEWKKTKGGVYLTVSVLTYLTILIVFGGESYGWYKYPLFPFLAIAIARIIQKIFESPNLLILITLALLPFGSSVHRLVGFVEFQKYSIFLKLFSIFVFLFFTLSIFLKKKISLKIQRILLVIVIAFLFWLSIKEIFYYTIDKWYFVT